VSLLAEPRDFVDGASGRVGLAVIYNAIRPESITASESGPICWLHFCVAPNALDGDARVAVIPAARTHETSVWEGVDWVTFYGLADEHGGVSGETGQPVSTPGAVAISGPPLPENGCPEPDFEPPPAARAEYRLSGPESVTSDESFTVEFRIDTNVVLTAVSAAMAFDPNKIEVTGASVNWRPGEPFADGAFRLVSFDNATGTVGVVVMSLIGPQTSLPAGARLLASIDAVALPQPILTESSVDFVEEVRHVLDPAEDEIRTADGQPVEYTYRNWATDDWGMDLFAPELIGASVSIDRLDGLALAIHPAADFLRGDSNGDGRVDLSDGIHALAYLFAGGLAPDCIDATDVDDSGSLEISDAIYLVSFLYLGGSAPPQPGPSQPGPDPTPDGLSCR
jgi:hypothetical protein